MIAEHERRVAILQAITSDSCAANMSTGDIDRLGSAIHVALLAILPAPDEAEAAEDIAAILGWGGQVPQECRRLAAVGYRRLFPPPGPKTRGEVVAAWFLDSQHTFKESELAAKIDAAIAAGENASADFAAKIFARLQTELPAIDPNELRLAAERIVEDLTADAAVAKEEEAQP
jgi:hypothetical protein